MKLIKQEEGRPIEFQGELTFGFSGEWLVEVEAQRTENANESKVLNLLVKPRLTDIQTQIVQYDLPEDGLVNITVYDLCKYYELEGDIDISEGLKDLWNYYHVDLADYPDLQKDFKDSDDMTRRYKMLNSFGLTIDDDGEVVENQEGYEYRMSLEDQFNFNQDNEGTDDNNEDYEDDDNINNEITENPKKSNLILYLGLGIGVFLMIIILIIVAKS